MAEVGGVGSTALVTGEAHKTTAPRAEGSAPALTLVVPVYNEAENILGTLRQIESQPLPSHEILVVYDRDDDTTLPVLAASAASFPQTRAVKNALGPGVLNAIRTGLKTAKGEAVVVVMADMADDLRALGPMLEAFAAGADVVCGSRYMRGGEQRGGPKLKGLLSRTAGLSLHLITRIPTHDVTNSFKLYRRSFLETVSIESRGGFEIGMELTVKAFTGGYRVAEVPSVWTDRTAGQSRFKLWRWLPRYLKWYLYAFHRRARTSSGSPTPGKAE